MLIVVAVRGNIIAVDISSQHILRQSFFSLQHEESFISQKFLYEGRMNFLRASYQYWCKNEVNFRVPIFMISSELLTFLLKYYACWIIHSIPFKYFPVQKFNINTCTMAKASRQMRHMTFTPAFVTNPNMPFVCVLTDLLKRKTG